MAAIKDLIEDIAKALVDEPEQVLVGEVEGEQVTVLELRVSPSDLGKVIGKQGRNCTVDSYVARSGWDEAEPAIHSGDPGVEF